MKYKSVGIILITLSVICTLYSLSYVYYYCIRGFCEIQNATWLFDIKTKEGEVLSCPN
jgi:hypothetical protein